MKVKLILTLLALPLFLLVSCGEDDLLEEHEALPQSVKVYNMQLDGNVECFDGAQTRSASSVWQENDMIFLTYRVGDSSISGLATYSNGNWSVAVETGEYDVDALLSNPSGIGKAYFVPNAQATWNSSTRKLAINAFNEIYADESVSIKLVGTSNLRVTINLKPLTGRLRYKGTPGTTFYTYGYNYFTELQADGCVLQESIAFIGLLTIGADGYSPYVYGYYPTTPRYLYFMSGDNAGDYGKECDANVLEIGKSGFLNVPTSASHAGWTDFGHKYVDLGLPSGTLWATTNVGAASPADFGNHYAWGEIATKTDYSWNTYKWSENGSTTALTKYCADEANVYYDGRSLLESVDDVATVEWGSEWCTPTVAQQEELTNTNHTTWTWTQRAQSNGTSVNGYLVKSKVNGNSIFLPAAGCQYNEAINRVNERGFYWASELDSGRSYGGRTLYFLSGSYGYMYYTERNYGCSVRPVRASV